VELHHLHVLQRHAGAERHRHPVAGAGVGVGRPDVEPACPAGRQDHRFGADRLQAAVQQIPGDHALAAVVVDHELPGEVLLVRLDVTFHHLLVEDVDEHVAGDVRGVRGARLAGGAKGTLSNPAVLGTREDGAPVLELVDVVRRLVAEHLDRVLVAEVVRTLDRVESMLLRVVIRGVAERSVDPTLGRAGVAAHRVDLGEKRHIGARVESLDRGPHSRAAGTDDQHVVLRFHSLGRYRKRLGLGFVAAAASAGREHADAAVAPPKRSDRRVKPLWTTNAPLGRAPVAATPTVGIVASAVAVQHVVGSKPDQAVGPALAFEPVHPATA
jgi:hypothetical protein